MSDQQQPTEPGWHRQPDDPSNIERWWTGIEWSEYTREVAEGDAVTDSGQAGDTPTAATDQAAAGEPTTTDAATTDPTSTVPTQPTADSAPANSAPAASQPASPPAADPGPTAPPAYASVPAPDPSGPLAFAAYQGDAEAAGFSMAGAVGLLDRLKGDDDGESGWDRNLATMAWLPLLNLLAILAYVLSGAHMARGTRSHIAGAINLGISNAIMSLGIFSITLLYGFSTAGAVIWAIVIGGTFAFVVYLLSSSDSAESSAVGYWIWFGVWAFVAFVCALSDAGPYVYSFVFGVAVFVLMVTNAVRGRLGMGARFFGYPVLPVLSRR